MEKKKIIIISLVLTLIIIAIVVLALVPNNSVSSNSTSVDLVSNNIASISDNISENSISANNIFSEDSDYDFEKAESLDAITDNNSSSVSLDSSESVDLTDIDLNENVNDSSIDNNDDKNNNDLVSNSDIQNTSINDSNNNSSVSVNSTDIAIQTTVSNNDIVSVQSQQEENLYVQTNYNVTTNRYNNIINTDVSLPANPKYSIYVNKSLNTVTVFVIDDNGLEIPFKAMLCSCGRSGHGTPAGTFKTTNYYDWRLMVDNTYGHYAVRFNNKILFHSVPYISNSPDTLEWDQFNLLGSNASLGCVRMAIADVKWIYDNCRVGTKVVVYSDESNPGPLGKPEPIRIPEDSPYKNWDPTDANPLNPWNAVNQ